MHMHMHMHMHTHIARCSASCALGTSRGALLWRVQVRASRMLKRWESRLSLNYGFLTLSRSALTVLLLCPQLANLQPAQVPHTVARRLLQPSILVIPAAGSAAAPGLACALTRTQIVWSWRETPSPASPALPAQQQLAGAWHELRSHGTPPRPPGPLLPEHPWKGCGACARQEPWEGKRAAQGAGRRRRAPQLHETGLYLPSWWPPEGGWPWV